jgi:two-component system nitrogen regulation sensor histidine kinase NtrY
VPEFAELFGKLDARRGGIAQGEVRLRGKSGERDLLVRMATRQSDDGRVEGFVVSFDDVTDLAVAQRMAAWGDVARRIAHEVKNPLTPIQLSAERLRRKFGPMVGEADRAALEQYADVIVRQTNDLRRIVDEFSRFARMRAPERKPADLGKLVADVVLLQETARPEIHYRLTLPETAVLANVDATMINQALTNLLKNAAEAIEENARDGADGPPEIRVALAVETDALVIDIQDNGPGLPEQPARLFEPYVTYRAKGTGLGLPIVKKIIEEHDGTLELTPAPVFGSATRPGAWARIVLPRAIPDHATEGDARSKIAEKLREGI